MLVDTNFRKSDHATSFARSRNSRERSRNSREDDSPTGRRSLIVEPDEDFHDAGEEKFEESCRRLEIQVIDTSTHTEQASA